MPLQVATAWDRPYLPRHGREGRALLVRVEATDLPRVPVSLMLLLDVGSATPGARRAELAALLLRAARAGLGAGDELAASTFDWRVRLGWEWAPHGDCAPDPPRASSGLVAGLEAARLRIDERGGVSQRIPVVLLITDDDPFDGDVVSAATRSAALQQVHALAAAGATVACVELGHGGAGLRVPLLAELADAGRGRFVSVAAAGDLEAEVRSLAAELAGPCMSDARLEVRGLSGSVLGVDRVWPAVALLDHPAQPFGLGALGARTEFLLSLAIDVRDGRPGQPWPVGELAVYGTDAAGGTVSTSVRLQATIDDTARVFTVDDAIDDLRRKADNARETLGRQQVDRAAQVKATRRLTELARGEDREVFAAQLTALEAGGELKPEDHAAAVRATRAAGWITGILGGIESRWRAL